MNRKKKIRIRLSFCKTAKKKKNMRQEEINTRCHRENEKEKTGERLWAAASLAAGGTAKVISASRTEHLLPSPHDQSFRVPTVHVSTRCDHIRPGFVFSLALTADLRSPPPPPRPPLPPLPPPFPSLLAAFFHVSCSTYMLLSTYIYIYLVCHSAWTSSRAGEVFLKKVRRHGNGSAAARWTSVSLQKVFCRFERLGCAFTFQRTYMLSWDVSCRRTGFFSHDPASAALLLTGAD